MNRMIAIDQIVIGKRRRALRPETVETIAESIREIGLLNPITVISYRTFEASSSREQFQLITGHHRFEACKRIGMQEIEARVITAQDVDQRLAEIDENLCRAELTQLERAEHLKERKDLYEMKHPGTKHGACGGGKNGVGTRERTEKEIFSFSVDTAQKTGVTDRNIRQAVRRANSISQEVRDTIREVASIADNSLELDALANLEEAEQKAAVQAVLGGKARSIREVIRQKEEDAHPPTRERQAGSSGNSDAELQQWKRQAREASSEVMAAKDNIRALKNQVAELETRIKELESAPPPPVVIPSTDLEAWKTRALQAEEECIVLQHRMTEMEQENSSPPNQGSRGLALRSLLDELETALKTTPAEFRPDVLDWFEDCFMNLVFLIKNIKRRTN